MAMDKAQKQLIDTYFRKRKIAQKESESYKFKIYENLYLFEIGRYDLVAMSVPTHPEDTEYGELVTAVANSPEEKFNKIHWNEVPDYMTRHIFVERYKDNENLKIEDIDWNKVGYDSAVTILSGHLEFFEKFKSMGLFDKLDAGGIMGLYRINPMFMHYLDLSKYDFGEENGMRMGYINRNYPGLATIIKQQKEQNG